jgi:hypothetical protein
MGFSTCTPFFITYLSFIKTENNNGAAINEESIVGERGKKEI